MNFQTSDRNGTAVTVDIFSGLTFFSPENMTEATIFAIVPNASGGHVALGTINASRTIVDLDKSIEIPASELAASIARGDVIAIETCPGCGGRNFRTLNVWAGESVNQCDGCGGTWSRNISREHADVLVQPMGTRFPYGAYPEMAREYAFDFSDAARSYRRHGIAKCGVCVQVG